VFGRTGDKEATVYYRSPWEDKGELKHWMGPRGVDEVPEVLKELTEGVEFVP